MTSRVLADVLKEGFPRGQRGHGARVTGDGAAKEFRRWSASTRRRSCSITARRILEYVLRQLAGK